MVPAAPGDRWDDGRGGGAALAGVVGWRMGLCWWWGLVAVGVAVAAVSLTVVVGFAGIVMVAAAPVLASLLSEVVGRPTSAGVRVRRPGVRVWLALAVTVALIVGASLWWDHREDERTVSRLEATGLAPYAPTEVPGVRIKVPMGSAGRLRYLLEMQGRSTLRVQQSGEDVAALCARVEGRTCESAAPGVTVVRHGGQVEAVVLDVPGGVVDLRPTSPSTSGWTEGQLVRLTREFRPTNARWLVDHER